MRQKGDRVSVSLYRKFGNGGAGFAPYAPQSFCYWRVGSLINYSPVFGMLDVMESGHGRAVFVAIISGFSELSLSPLVFNTPRILLIGR